jgi:serine/threonine protein phosphatase PrpC
MGSSSGAAAAILLSAHTHWGGHVSMIELAWGAATECGPFREHNEDNLLARAPIFVVADGMGGRAGGGIASQLAVVAFERLTGADAVPLASVLEAISAANSSIVDAARVDPRWQGMGTTIVGLAFVEDLRERYWLVFNIGDSRLYRLAAGAFEQLTVDHTEFALRARPESSDPAHAGADSGQHLLTRVVGSEPPPVADYSLMCPVHGERFLLCSDGLSGAVTAAGIERRLAVPDQPDAVARRLVADALEAGSRDNVTAVVVDVVGGVS